MLTALCLLILLYTYAGAKPCRTYGDSSTIPRVTGGPYHRNVTSRGNVDINTMGFEAKCRPLEKNQWLRIEAGYLDA